MPDSPAPQAFADIVTRLRAAGCVFADDEAALILAATDSESERELLVSRRATGEPLEYVLGWAEFCGHRILLDPGVFVPRKRTEYLAEQAIAHASAGCVVVDLCCGAGALGVAISAAVCAVDLHCTDVDPVAVHCARRNVPPASGRVHEGDLYSALPDGLCGRIDVLVANAPYVPTDSIALMPPEARDHEHRVALDGGGDGMEVLRALIVDAPTWLAPGGALMFETSRAQSRTARDAVEAAGLDAEILSRPETGSTVILGRRAG